jgi:hypothetical protein
MLDLERVSARSLGYDCNLESFSCGEHSIDDWVRKDALVQHERFRSRVVTYHEDEDPNPRGVYSLKIVLESEKEVRKTLDVRRWVTYARFPALHLQYLGVCSNHKSQGLGSYILMDVLDKFCLLAEMTGVPVLTLQTLNPDLKEYYGARNFVEYGRNGGMLISAETALKLVRGTSAVSPNGLDSGA